MTTVTEETTSEETKDYSRFKGKKVKVVQSPADSSETVEVEGTVQVWNVDLGLLIKPRGKVNFELIPTAEIEDVFEIKEKEKEFKAVRLNPIEEGKVRKHLLTSHGVTLEWVNTNTEEDAKTYHDSLDHVAEKLGHYHAEPRKKDENKSEGK